MNTVGGFLSIRDPIVASTYSRIMSSSASDDVKRLRFLCEGAAVYSGQCPQVAAQLMSRVTAILSNWSDHLPLTTCPHCSTPLTPHTSTHRTLSSRTLRKKRRFGKFKGFTILRNTYCTEHPMIIHCKMCRQSFLTRNSNPLTPHHTPHSTPRHKPRSSPHHTPHSTPRHKPHSTPHHTPHSTPCHKPRSSPHHTPHSTPCHTPHSTSRHRPHSTSHHVRSTKPSASRHRSSTLKSLLRASSEAKKKDSPKLTDFLTTVHV